MLEYHTHCFIARTRLVPCVTGVLELDLSPKLSLSKKKGELALCSLDDDNIIVPLPVGRESTCFAAVLANVTSQNWELVMWKRVRNE